jgi:hypothetical protein
VEERQIGDKLMKVLLTGGSGNLDQTLVPRLLDQGDTPVILDVRAPRDLKKGANQAGYFRDGSMAGLQTVVQPGEFAIGTGQPTAIAGRGNLPRQKEAHAPAQQFPPAMARPLTRRAALPEWIRPQLTQLVDAAPEGDPCYTK